MAKSKLNVAVVARTQSKLDELAESIRSKYGVEVLVIAQDLAAEGAVEAVMQAMAGKEVGVLVNNAGLSYSHPAYLHEVDAGRLETLLSLNVAALTLLTHAVLPQMVERKRGAIVNIGSISGDTPCGLLAAYGSSKTYVQYFSQALDQEYGPKGIFVQCVRPGFVSTAISKMKPALTVPTPAAYAKSAVDTIGHDKLTYGFF